MNQPNGRVIRTIQIDDRRTHTSVDVPHGSVFLINSVTGHMEGGSIRLSAKIEVDPAEKRMAIVDTVSVSEATSLEGVDLDDERRAIIASLCSPHPSTDPELQRLASLFRSVWQHLGSVHWAEYGLGAGCTVTLRRHVYVLLSVPNDANLTMRPVD